MMREALIWKLSNKPLNRVNEDEMDFISKFAKSLPKYRLSQLSMNSIRLIIT